MPTPEEGIQSQLRNIERTYSRSIDELVADVAGSGLTKHPEVVAMLKQRHGMAHGAAHRVSLVARDRLTGPQSHVSAAPPESLQAAVAAGLCGLGTVFVGSTEGATKMLYEALEDRGDADLQSIAVATVAKYHREGAVVPGLGHPVHRPIDPRTPRLFEIAADNGMANDYCKLMQLIATEAERVSGKSLTLNATGAVGAICCELGFPWKIVRGLGVMARAIGLVGHLLEESENPMAMEILWRVDEAASAHLRNA